MFVCTKVLEQRVACKASKNVQYHNMFAIPMKMNTKEAIDIVFTSTRKN